MVSRSILAVTAVAISFLGAEASPCRPTTVTSLSESETSSVVVSVSEATTLTTLIETTPATVAEATSTILEEVTTTSEAPAGVETQVIYNSGFDGNDALSPWIGDGEVTKNGAYSAPNALALKFHSGIGSATFTQNLPTLEGDYELSYRWAIPEVDVGEGFVCSILPKIGGDFMGTLHSDEFSGWALETRPWSSGGNAVTQAALVFDLACFGGYDQLTITLDDITLTRVSGRASR